MPVRLPPAPYPPGYADVAPGYNVPGMNIPVVGSNAAVRDQGMRYPRYEGHPTADQVAIELRRHRMDVERSRRRSEMTDRGRRDVIRQELVAARGMAPLDWDMDEL